MKRNRVFAVLAVLTVFLSACGINSIPRAEEEAKAKWANVQAAYQRRLDTLQSLVNAARAAGQHERGLQIGYAQARSGADGARVTGDQLTDPAAMQRFAAAQQGVSAFIVRATAEQPPTNQANSNWREVITQIEGANNRITVAIRDYNEAVQAYNTRIRTFPSVIGARVVYGSHPMVPFEATAGANVAPDLDFGNLQE
jgi:LemA protein